MVVAPGPFDLASHPLSRVVIVRGVAYSVDEEQLIDEIRDGVDASLVQAAKDGVHDLDALQSILHDDLAALAFKKLKRRPMVMPVVVEV